MDKQLKKLIFNYLDTYMGDKTISVYYAEISFGGEFTYYPGIDILKNWKTTPTDISLMFGMERSKVWLIIREWVIRIVDILEETTKSLGYKIKVEDAIAKRDENELEDLNESVEEQLKPLIFNYWDLLVKDGTFKESDMVDDFDIVDSNGEIFVMNNNTGENIAANIKFYNDVYNFFGIKKEDKFDLRPYINEWGKSIFDNMTNSMKVSDTIKKRDSGNTLNESINTKMGNIIFEYLNHILSDKKIMFYHGDYANISDIYPIVDNVEDHIWYLAWDGGSVRVNPKLLKNIKSVFLLEEDELLNYIGKWYGILLKKDVKRVHEFKFQMREVFDFTLSGRVMATVSDLVKVNKPNLSLNEDINKLEEIVLDYIKLIVNDYKPIEYGEYIYYINPYTKEWLFIDSSEEFEICVNPKLKQDIQSMFGINESKLNKIIKKWFIDKKINNQYTSITYMCNPIKEHIEKILRSDKNNIDENRIYRLTENTNELPQPNLKYYAFDWDDNIVRMPTQIILLSDDGKKVGMSTKDYAKYREYIGKQTFEYKDKIIKDYSDNPFVNFRTEGDKDFLIDSMLAEPGPSWKDFVEAINNGSIFSIITARGHNPETLKQGVYNYIISNFNGINKDELIKNLKKYRNLTDEDDSDDIDLIREYLNLCRFYPISFDSENEKHPEKMKVKALNHFMKYVKSLVKDLNEKIYIKNNIKNYFNPTIGFSDDDVKNITTIRNKFKNNKTIKTFYTGNNTKE
jgi:hypothetical protein